MTARQARPFVRLDVWLAANPKLLQVPPLARWLYVVSITVAGRSLSDGRVRRSVVTVEAEVPDKTAAPLLKVGLWHEPGHGCPRCPQLEPGWVVVHDYIVWQQTRAEVEERSAARSAAGRKGALVRWGQGQQEGDS